MHAVAHKESDRQAVRRPYPRWERRHEGVLLTLLERPWLTLEQCAAVTGYSPSQLSRITCSPEFRRRFRTAIDRAQLDAVSRFMLERSKYCAELRPPRRPFEP